MPRSVNAPSRGAFILNDSGATVRTRAAPHTVESFLRNNGNHDQSCKRVSPPSAEGSVEQQTDQQDRRQIGAKFCLFRIRVHGGASHRTSHTSFCPGKQRHHYQRNTRQNDSWNAVLRGSLGPQIQNRVVGDVGSEQEKASANKSKRPLFVCFPEMHIRINGHPPEQDRSRRYFDETVNSKADQRNTSGQRACDDSD
jgi:hypothetical protein